LKRGEEKKKSAKKRKEEKATPTARASLVLICRAIDITITCRLMDSSAITFISEEEAVGCEC
jgi:hypothetical protein